MVNKLVYFLMKKKRSTTDVAQEPPLFPWETEVTDYTEDASGELVPPQTTHETKLTPNGHDKEAPPPSFSP